MAAPTASIPHIIRTAQDARLDGVWQARLSRIEQVNSKIRLLRLSLTGEHPSLRHLPGQYIDLYLPNVEQVGGFTITSSPHTSLDQQDAPYIELAIQASPDNPPAAFLWRHVPEIINTTVEFRVGGTFVFPSSDHTPDECADLDRAVFIAGGVGINPIMSMISAMDETGTTSKIGGMPPVVRVLYTSRRLPDVHNRAEPVLFDERLTAIAQKWSSSSRTDFHYALFETGTPTGRTPDAWSRSPGKSVHQRRITHQDLLEAIGPEPCRRHTIVYVCGLPGMTDDFVAWLRRTPGVDARNVLCEKWW